MSSSYYMSGTSQATAVMSGLAALLLEVDPCLTPDRKASRPHPPGLAGPAPARLDHQVHVPIGPDADVTAVAELKGGGAAADVA